MNTDPKRRLAIAAAGLSAGALLAASRSLEGPGRAAALAGLVALAAVVLALAARSALRQVEREKRQGAPGNAAPGEALPRSVPPGNGRGEARR